MSESEPTPASGGFRALLHNHAFLKLWVGQIVSQLADKVFLVLLITLVVNYEPPRYFANSMNSAVMIANTLPAILFGSAAGVFVDRLSKRQIMSSSNILRGFLVLLIPILPKAFGWLLLVAFLESILTQFFAPAEQAAIPLVVPEQNLLAANALFVTTMMGSLVVGFAVGEPILSWANTWGTYGRELLVGGLYILAGVILLSLPKEQGLSGKHLALHPFEDIKEGFRYISTNRLLSTAMIQLTILYCAFAALTILAVSLAAVIGLRSNQFGFLLAAAGIGLIIGAGVLGQWGNRLHGKPLPLIGFLSMAAVLVGFCLVTNRWLGLGLSMLLGLGASMIGVPMQTVLQQQTPEAMRGKVFGFQNNIVNIALSIPLVVVGLLTDGAGAMVEKVKTLLVDQGMLTAAASGAINSQEMGLRIVLLAMSGVVAYAGIWAWRNTRKVLADVI